MLKARKRFPRTRGPLLMALALVLTAGTAPAWAQKSESQASGSQRMQSSPRSSPRAAPRSSPGTRPSSRSGSGSEWGTGSRSRVGPSSRSSTGTGVPSSGYSPGLEAHRKGRFPSAATIEAAPAPGPRFTPRETDRAYGPSGGDHRVSDRRGHSRFGSERHFFYGHYPYSYLGIGCLDYDPYPFLRGSDYNPYDYPYVYYPYAIHYRTAELEAQGGLGRDFDGSSGDTGEE